ncbi:SGNH/GDSL hydrolase family protein [Fulvivirgaceae bacterium PWU4]|uniref:SGNH/GDSL hydrolase family protein n=1 Tax=Chryseosolibacter histidini TaxID=2782349 RepID=A0AAP2DPZ2_9BACT|nr:SGNH/GDSL hydrolase family protein [Chryseosolibacter histidini]MBT1699223.1 SGNH/GDSL hydrolase family protein [Chryseosolibacter histidini]
MKQYIIFLLLLSSVAPRAFAQADHETYLQDIKATLKKQWPANRTINLVFHGHSVPSGYFRTPDVRTLDAYPQQVLAALKEIYPTAVINVIVTAIGGENSVQGEKRFNDEVLVHRPDIIFIDYALNDWSPGLAKAGEATEKMIRKALKKNIKVILLTPSPDFGRVNMKDPDNLLAQFTQQITAFAKQYNIGLADTYASFQQRAAQGEDLQRYMAQSNHPNRDGHALIAAEIMKYFK